MSGGIWILWSDDNINFKPLISHKKFLHCEVSGIGRSIWAFTTVYASPREIERRELWDKLRDIVGQIKLPWMLTGDFNDIKSNEEQRGRAVVNLN